MFLLKRIHSDKDENPLILIPGLFGSMGNDIIHGTGKFSFGFAEYAYRPIIDNLLSLGYEENKNLFVSFYNWTQGNEYNAEKYLSPMIRKVKNITGYNKVNLICHSMGGLVARAYVQGNLYNHDVDKLIMIGTPNRGSVDAYYFWGGRDVPYDDVRENFIYRIIRMGFLWLFDRLYGDDKEVDSIRGYFPSIKELLPTNDYGDYIFHENDSKYKEFIPVENMRSQNDFLNRLNREQYILYKRNIKVYLIAGKGIETNRYICVNRDRNFRESWLDGKPIYNVKSQMGDGIVTCFSVKGVYGEYIYIKGDHVKILKGCGNILSNILGRKSIVRKDLVKESEDGILYSIIGTNIDNILINLDGQKKVVQGDIRKNDTGIEAKEVGKNTYWIIINLRGPNMITITFNPIGGKESNIVVFAAEKNKHLKKIKEEKIMKTHRIEL